MANLSITVGSVLAGSGARVLRRRTAGSGITQGQPLYKNASGLYIPATAGGTSVESVVAGISLNACSAGQPVDLIRAGLFTPGATLATGVQYALSQTTGLICPIADIVTSSKFVVPLFQAITTTTAQVNIIANAVALA